MYETLAIVRGDVLRTTYGTNPFQEKQQVITSVSWVSRMEDARESLLRSRWDLVIVDEAHKMSAYSEDKKTLAYQLGEALSQMTDHYLLMTATPHKGDPKNFYLFLKLLDADVYGDVSSLEEAIRQRSAPFYLRRVKEALVTFPSPEDGKVKTLFTRRNVQTVEFELDDDEWDFYNALSDYVDDQSEKAASDTSARGRALGFTMAMLQRRFASSIYAARRSLERMKDRREKILADPETHRQQQIQRKIPDDFDEMPAEEQQELLDYLETVVGSVDPLDLKHEIAQLGRLIQQAQALEAREIETKLARLIEVDLPIKRISAHARREKSIRHGHISTLHIWWARRPLAACRAVICAALWPDPADEQCPPAIRQRGRARVHHARQEEGAAATRHVRHRAGG
jgi:SNF2 family DNA or RNA helicase